MGLDVHVGAAVNFLVSRGAVGRGDDGRLSIRRESSWVCELFASQIMPFVEALSTAMRHVTERMTDACEERELLSAMMRTGQDLLLLDYVRYREGMTKAGFENAVRALISAGILNVKGPQGGERGSKTYSLSQDPKVSLTFKAQLEKIL